ncbi:MAG: hypothetical protein OEM64_05585 [Gammaproteobacteria bacterium]|nr:hypothetical protein [Gammaproteobacteria bacterium]MDH3415767.1 hypothetical protein [Gammaproteobacteria bacterium]
MLIVDLSVDTGTWIREMVENSDGVFGFVGMMACHDVCPKELALLEVYACLRRKVLTTKIRNL